MSIGRGRTNKLRIAIIDADLITKKNHRFPNLVCMKLSGYYKDRNIWKRSNEVELKTEYSNLEKFDKIYIAKVFTDTLVPQEVLTLPNVVYGGTGFFYDRAKPLPMDIEHHTPDYHLYDEWVQSEIVAGRKKSKFDYYLKYAIGFLTRGCFRKCSFCVNQNYDRVIKASPLSEFISDRKKICLLDDNFFGYPKWKDLLLELIETNLPFQFKQGLDERLLTEEKAELLFNSRYDGDFIFAFDNIADTPIITDKLKLIRKHTNKNVKFYCLCGYDRDGSYSKEFWYQDILDLISRIDILMNYKCLPYIMRYNKYEESPYRGIYILLAEWCGQVRFFKKKSLREFVECENRPARNRYFELLLKDFPNIRDFVNKKF